MIKRMTSNLYSFYVKNSYRFISEIKEKERVYKKDFNYVIFVEDPETRKALYEGLKVLSQRNEQYLLPIGNFRLIRYGLKKDNSVYWFEVEAYIHEQWRNLSKLYKLLNFQRVIERMERKGLVLDVAKFKKIETLMIGKTVGIGELLACFIPCCEEQKIQQAKAYMIEYIHSELLDCHLEFHEKRNLKDFYETVVGEQAFCERNQLPSYSISILKMCYEYFKTGALPSNISNILMSSLQKRELDRLPIKIMFHRPLDSQITEKKDEYTIYDGKIKIYHRHDWLDYLRDTMYCKSKDDWKRIFDYSFEKIEYLIIDLEDNCIGYQFATEESQEVHAILDISFPDSNIIFKCIGSLEDFLRKYVYDWEDKRYISSKEFKLEKSLVSNTDWYDFPKPCYKFATLQDVWDFINGYPKWLEQQIANLFFQLLAKYMQEKYGVIKNRKVLLEKQETRYLSPILVKWFVQFLKGNTVDYEQVTGELLEMFSEPKIATFENSTFIYDARFCYDPSTIQFTFDYEVESKYNMQLQMGMKKKKLADSRVLVMLDRRKAIEDFQKKQKKIEWKIYEQNKHVDDEHFVFTGVSEIILDSKKWSSNGMYSVLGYITNPIPGEEITEEKLLSLNQKEILKVGAYLLCHFSKFNFRIPWYHSYIWMTPDFCFYIDYLSEEFQVLDKEQKDVSAIVSAAFQSLVKIGYNPNAFMGWHLPSHANFEDTRKFLLELVNSFDTYCEEHQIYYEGKQGFCPICVKTHYLVPKDFEQVFPKVFEDDVASHYQLMDGYHLKVYRTANENMPQIEANVTRIVNENLQSPGVNLYQDCFVPFKKAVDEQQNFIGYVYEATRFKNRDGDMTDKSRDGGMTDVCIDLMDTENLNTLARIKSLVRFLLQIREMNGKNYGFLRNPFSHVFLNVSHKKQVQILNIEFLNQESKIEKTKEWAYEYVYQVIQTDEILKNAWLKEKQKQAPIAWLVDLSKQLTKYCPIHRNYYNKKYLCCPQCVPLEKQVIERGYEDKTKYKEEECINRGGESFIYSYGKDFVVKVFKVDKVDMSLKNSVIFRVWQRKSILEKMNQEKKKYHYVIPKRVLLDKETNEIFAYVMEKVKNAFPLSTLRDRAEVEKLGFSQRDIFQILITTGQGIERLHRECHIYIGDLNGRNILFDKQKNVYFLEFDSVGIDEISPEFCTDGYIDPQSKKSHRITMEDDWYSFAVQAFYYLTYTHPFNGIYYENVDGRQILLEIPDKMERRISLLGNHGMQPPEVALSWDWMNNDLREAFLSIFEGDNRENLVPYLKRQYQTLFKELLENLEEDLEENLEENLKVDWLQYRSQVENQTLLNQLAQSSNEFWINSKFVAKKENPFKGEMIRVICPYAAICRENEKGYIALLVKRENQIVQKNIFPFFITEDHYQLDINVDEGVSAVSKSAMNSFSNNMEGVFLSQEEDFVAVVYHETGESRKLYVFDLEKEKMIYSEEMPQYVGVTSYDVIFNDRTMYFIDWNKEIGEYIISKREILADGVIQKERIKLAIGISTLKCFDVRKHSKFVLVTQDGSVYCNNEKVYKFTESFKSFRYRVLYDTLKKIWLVLGDSGLGFMIHLNGRKMKIDISGKVNRENLNYVRFENGVICIPAQDCLYIVKKQEVKKMECDKIMTPTSQIYNINSQGFCVITQNVFYEVRKGEERQQKSAV